MRNEGSKQGTHTQKKGEKKKQSKQFKQTKQTTQHKSLMTPATTFFVHRLVHRLQGNTTDAEIVHCTNTTHNNERALLRGADHLLRGGLSASRFPQKCTCESPPRAVLEQRLASLSYHTLTSADQGLWEPNKGEAETPTAIAH